MNPQTLPINIVGSSTFGRYPKISVEQTYNMIISDNWLVPYAGHKSVKVMNATYHSRGIFYSTRFGHLITVVGQNIYSVDTNINVSLIASIDTFSGDVFIEENNNNQIAICDRKDIYIYNHATTVFSKAVLNFTPNYITFQDGYFIAAVTGQASWRLSALNDGLTWPSAAANIGTFQTKPDNVVACKRFPGKGNLLLIMGNTVSELWIDVGYQLFPYQRNSSFNIDYGCRNPSTIAASDSFIIWLGSNEKSGLAILMCDGGSLQQISSDGINFLLGNLQNPQNSYGFLFKQDGHLIYQLNFYDPKDNISIAYDFTTQKFFNLCDQNMNYHIASNVAYFNGKYYFITKNNGNLYEFDASLTTYDGEEIPRIRICSNTRLPDAAQFIANKLTFTLEQGQDANISRVDLTVSRDGGVSFGNVYSEQLNDYAVRPNKLIYWNLGFANDFVPQFRFWGQGRFVCNNGLLSIYQ